MRREYAERKRITDNPLADAAYTFAYGCFCILTNSLGILIGENKLEKSVNISKEAARAA